MSALRRSPAAALPSALPLAPAIPIVVTLVANAGTRWYPVSDLAQAEMRMQAFWSHPPLIGAAGRIGPLFRQGAHPGPAAWWFAEPVYRVFGRTSFAFLVATGVLSIVWLAVAIQLTRRRAGNVAAAALTALILAFMRVWGAEVFVHPWNPWLGLTAFVAFVAIVWSAAEGARFGIAASVVLGSYCVQAHAGYTVIVAALCAAACVGSAVRRWRSRRRECVIDLAAGATAGMTMWLPPVIEQLRSEYGNLRILAEHFGSPPEAPIGVRAGARLVAASFNVRGDWWIGDGALPLDRRVTMGSAAFVLLWAAAIALSGRARRFDQLRLHGLLALAALVGWGSASRIFGTVFAYLAPWLAVLAAFTALAIGWSFATAVGALRRRRDAVAKPTRAGTKRAIVAVAAVLAILVGVDSIAFADAPVASDRVSLDMAALAPQVRAHLDRSKRYLVRWSDAVSLGAYGFGMVLDLNREGYRSFGLPVFRTTLLPHNVAEPSDVDETVAIVTGPQVAEWRSLPGAVEIGAVDRRSPAQRREVERLTEQVVEELRPIDPALADTVRTNYWAAIIDPRTPAPTLRRLERLRDLGLATTAFLVPPDQVPASER